MRIAFVSIMGSPWGGSEELWAATAREAMDAGCQVAFSTYEGPDIPPEVETW